MRLAHASAKFSEYLQSNGARRRTILGHAVATARKHGFLEKILYNGEVQSTSTDEPPSPMTPVFRAEEEKCRTTKHLATDDLDPEEVAAANKRRKKLSLRVAQLTAKRLNAPEEATFSDSGDSSQSGREPGKPGPLKRQDTTASMLSFGVESSGQSRMNKVVFQCERSVASLSSEELKHVAIADGAAYFVTMETYSSLLKIGFIHPGYKPKIRFDMFISVLILWSVIMLPYRIAFDDVPEWDTDPGMYLFEWFVDACFFVDIGLSFRTSYENINSRTVVASSRKVARHYLLGWFTVDILSTLPLDLIIGQLMGSDSQGSDLVSCF